MGSKAMDRDGLRSQPEPTDADRVLPHGFVGRAAELAALQQFAQTAIAGCPQFVLIEGAGGTGKSSLLRAFSGCISGPALVMVAGDEAETDLAHGVLDE